MPIHIFCSRTKFRDYVTQEDFLSKISDESLEIFSRPQVIENSRQYLLLQTTGGHFACACVHPLNDNSVVASNLMAGKLA